MSYEIKSVEFHKSAIERLESDLKRIKGSWDFEYSESGVSVWASEASIGYHRRAIAALEEGAELGIEGPAGYVKFLVSASGEIVSSKRYSKSYYGSVSWSWWLAPEFAAKYGRKYVPCGEKSRIQKELGLHEEEKLVPVKPYFEAHCSFIGAPVSLSVVPDFRYKIEGAA